MTLAKFLELAPNPRPLKDGQEYSVFLSYRSVDRKWVISLYDALTMAGHKVFLDQKELVAGGKLRRALEEALRASAGGILIWSHATADSDWVRDEYDAMQDRVKDRDGFCFVPVKLDDAELPTFAKSQLFVDFGAYPDGPNGGELLHLLHGLVGQPLSDSAMRFAESLSEQSREAEVLVTTAIETGDAEYLRELHDEGGLAWEVSPHLKSRVVEGFGRLGVPEAAIEIAEVLSKQFPTALRPKQMLAHLLTRLKTPDSLKKGQRILAALYTKGERDPETLGLYAKAVLETYMASGDDDTSRNQALLKRSRDLYKEGFENSKDTYCGINAAAKSLMLGGEDAAVGQSIAVKVAECLPQKISNKMGYWDAATIAEANLIAGRVEDAARLYRDAVSLAPLQTGSHEATYAQVQNIAAALGLSDNDKTCLAAPFSHLNAKCK